MPCALVRQFCEIIEKMTKKRMSKRMTCRKRYKIIKKVSEHHRKLRKIGKITRRSKRKDPGIPNSFPFKEELLREFIQTTEQEKIEKIQLKEKRQQEKQKETKKKEIVETVSKQIKLPPSLEAYAESAHTRSEEFSNKQSGSVQIDSVKDLSFRRFNKELQKVLQASDIIVEVIDARDPLGTRSPNLEEAVYKSGQNKQLVLLLNKIDLVPKSATLQWLTYLRNEYPTIAFKASTQLQKNRLGQVNTTFENVDESLLKLSVCIGAKTLVNFLKTFKRKEQNGVIGSLTVGVVGLPNVGKSSVINSLRRSKVCQVGAIPGVTKNMQEIKIDNSIRILDCPGVILPSMDRSSLSSLTIDVNSIDFTVENDYMIPINNILKCCPSSQLKEHLDIPDFNNDANTFLINLSKKYGKFKKGAIPDLKAAAKVFLNYWKSGKIRYHFLPPDAKYFKPLSVENASSWKQDFNLEAITVSEETDLNELLRDMSTNLFVESHYTPAHNGPIEHVGSNFAAEGRKKSNLVIESKKIIKKAGKSLAK